MEEINNQKNNLSLAPNFTQGLFPAIDKDVFVLARGPRTAKEIRRFAGGNFRDFEYLKYLLKFEEK